MISTFFLNSISSQNLVSSSNERNVVFRISSQTGSLSKRDVVNYFSNNLIEYFNPYKYYSITSEIYFQKEKQYDSTITTIVKNDKIFNVIYFGSGGWYAISFSNKEFSEPEKIFTFVSHTVLGNNIRGKVYDTFLAWIERVGIALKANDNLDLYIDELNAAVEIEKWYNNLNGNR